MLRLPYVLFILYLLYLRAFPESPSCTSAPIAHLIGQLFLGLTAIVQSLGSDLANCSFSAAKPLNLRIHHVHERTALFFIS